MRRSEYKLNEGKKQGKGKTKIYSFRDRDGFCLRYGTLTT